MDIKVRAMEKYGITPDCVVITATMRALKMHGGAFEASPGKKLDEELLQEGEHARPRGRHREPGQAHREHEAVRHSGGRDR